MNLNQILGIIIVLIMMGAVIGFMMTLCCRRGTKQGARYHIISEIDCLYTSYDGVDEETIPCPDVQHTREVSLYASFFMSESVIRSIEAYYIE